jgi:hypothetical protein
MATTRILLFLLCFVPVISSWLPDRDLLSSASSVKGAGRLIRERRTSSPITATSTLSFYSRTGAVSNRSITANYRKGALIGSLWKVAIDKESKLIRMAEAENNIISIAEKELGVRERSGKNDGLPVETYLRYVKLDKGYPWCAAFVSWIFGQAGYSKPRSAWSPDLFPASRLSPAPRIAAVLGIYFPALKRIAHVGLVTGLQHDWVESVEGNTNAAGSREGDGVYRRLRHKRFIYRYALYL